MFAILLTVFILNEKSLFPGFWALIPTLTSACIIQAKNSAFINKNILSSKAFVFIGKISYSWYLWHWPLIVFSRTFYPEGSESIFASMLFIIFLSIVFSCLTYFLVENPVRKSKEKKRTVVGLIVLMIIIGVISIALGTYVWLGNWAMDQQSA